MEQSNGIENGQNNQRKLIDGLKKFELFFDISALNEENLKLIPPGKPVIFAPSHITDLDVMFTILTLAKAGRRLAIANDSGHYDWKQNSVALAGMMYAGRELFTPVHHIKSDKNRVGDFTTWINSEEFRRLQKELTGGKDVIMASYFDPKYAGGKQELSDRNGVGAVYLAQATGALVVPIAVDLQMDGTFGLGNFSPLEYAKNWVGNGRAKPHADVIIGTPIQLSPIAGIDNLGQTIASRDRSGFGEIRQQLDAQSKMILKQTADMLPVQKRGSY